MSDAACAPVVEGWRFATADDRRDALRGAGFVDLAVRPVADAAERSARIGAARARLHARLEAATDDELGRLSRERSALTAALADGRLGLVQLVARRP